MTTISPNTVTAISDGPRDDAPAAAAGTADFDALFRAHQPRLVEALALVAGDRELAADAVQEAFVKAHLKWRRIGSYDDPIGWVRRVAINRLRDEHRRSRRKRRAIDRLASQSNGTPALPDRDLMSQDLVAQLADLPKRQRLCVVLRYVEDLSTAEIARTLDVSEGTVKSNLSDARARLRSRLGRPPGAPT